MAFWNLKSLHLEPFRPGVASKAVSGAQLIMVCMQIGPHLEDAGHTHPYDQCGVVLEGPIEMFIGSVQRVMQANEAYFIPAGVHHGWKTFETPARLLDASAKPA